MFSDLQAIQYIGFVIEDMPAAIGGEIDVPSAGAIPVSSVGRLGALCRLVGQERLTRSSASSGEVPLSCGNRAHVFL